MEIPQDLIIKFIAGTITTSVLAAGAVWTYLTKQIAKRDKTIDELRHDCNNEVEALRDEKNKELAALRQENKDLILSQQKLIKEWIGLDRGRYKHFFKEIDD